MYEIHHVGWDFSKVVARLETAAEADQWIRESHAQEDPTVLGVITGTPGALEYTQGRITGRIHVFSRFRVGSAREHTEKEARAKQQRADAAEAWTLAREIEMGFRRADGTRI